MTGPQQKRVIVAMTGASGAPLGVHLLQTLRDIDGIETHLILSKWARATIELETPHSVKDVQSWADVVHGDRDQAATISSGSFRTHGMIITPCSMKTLSGIRTGYADGLIGRAADVILKERRPLILVTRETPLSEIHLDNMLALSRMGAVIMPPMPAFYNTPQTVDDVVSHITSRTLDQLDIETPYAHRWAGTRAHRLPENSVSIGG
ncbi:MAG: non-oxidative hydroxyarylic acid decarboxylases subunit B [Mycobacterium sp.]|nr:non-oxidative hydroxyarylic acid decarboxylases subunit B [Mycobacterium sp.]